MKKNKVEIDVPDVEYKIIGDKLSAEECVTEQQ